jgi:hypothetical protein
MLTFIFAVTIPAPFSVSKETLRRIRRDLRRVSRPALRHHGNVKPQPGTRRAGRGYRRAGERLRRQVAPRGVLFLPGQ